MVQKKEQISEETWLLTKRLAADGFGVLLEGRGRQICRKVKKAFVMMEPGGGSPAIREKIFMDAVSMHSAEWNDLYFGRPGHPGAVILPVCLHLALLQGAGGEKFLWALLKAYSVASAINELLLPLHHDRGFHSTCTSGIYGAAAAAGSLLELKEEEFGAAFGLAGTFASGLRKSFGTDGNPLQVGQAAVKGMEAAFFAKAGLAGEKELLTRKGGFLDAFGGRRQNAELVLQGLRSGKFLENPGILIKKYPACYSVYQAVDAALEIAAEASCKLDEIEKIVCETCRLNLDALPDQIPTDEYQERFSIAYGIASALYFGKMDETCFGWSGNAEIQRLMRLVRLKEAPELVNHKEYGFTRVILFQKNGQVLQKTAFPNSQERLENWTEPALKEKFIHCTSKIWGKEDAGKVYESVERLETFRELRQWIDALPKGKGDTDVRF